MSVVLVVACVFLSASCLTAAQEQSSNESMAFPLRSALATQQLHGVSENRGTCSLFEARSEIEVAFQQLLREVVHKLTCDSVTLGVFEHCPAANCSQIFSVSQTFRFPDNYWITAENGSTIQIYCDFEFEQFLHGTAELDSTADHACPTVEQKEYVQKSTQANIQLQLSRVSPSLLSCATKITGLVAHCPANSCSQLFDLIQEGFLYLSNYYWLRSPAGEVTEVYCNRNTMQPEYSSCQQLFEFETLPSGIYTIRISDGIYVQVYCNNETGQTEYKSCSDANLFNLPSGTYTIRPSGSSPVTVYCDMDNEECGGGVWMRVTSYSYSDPSTACPGDWNLITSPIRSCGRRSTSASCSSAFFTTNNVEFNSVCGRVIAIQRGSPSAFYTYHNQNQRSIDGYYVDGVSITYGSPRQHVWTFAAYPSDDYTRPDNVCPCSQPSQAIPSTPHFVGNNYFCDTAASTCCSPISYPDDPLWDGQGCGGPSTCCSFNNPPWFSTALPETTSDNVEVRICDNEHSSYDNTPITHLDLYVQ